MHLKRRFFPLGVSAMCNHSKTPGGQLFRRFKCTAYTKQIKNIMKYQLYTNASKNNRRLLVVISE